jgi:NAD(P)-dependent dehydrogenase (short-subunit alcohol dehydrogenase family)
MTAPHPTQRLHAKVAIVTSAASGFGLAITHLFARQGCAVVAVDINAGALHNRFPPDSARQPASARIDGRVVAVVADVAVGADWVRCVEMAKQRFGGLDVVVNNAGVSYRKKVGWCLCQFVKGSGTLDPGWTTDLVRRMLILI